MGKTRVCVGCKKTLPIEKFSLDKTKPLGRTYRCRACTTLYKREVRERNPELYTGHQMKYRATHKNKIIETLKRWANKYPEKKKAHILVHAALKNIQNHIYITLITEHVIYIHLKKSLLKCAKWKVKSENYLIKR